MNSLDNEDPLTKPKKSKKPTMVITEQVISDVVEPVVEAVSIPEEPVIQTKKPRSQAQIDAAKKPRTQAQIDAFNRTALKRKENIANKLKEKELAKQPDIEVNAPKKINYTGSKPKQKPESVPIIEQESSESEPDIEVESKQSKQINKKKPRYIKVRLDSSSDEESDGYDSPVEVKAMKPNTNTRAFSSQQNKKSKIKVHNSAPVNYDNFFAD
jgi:hypothetical protein